MSDTTQQAEYWVIVHPSGKPLCAGRTQSEAWHTLGRIEGMSAQNAVWPAQTGLVPYEAVPDPRPLRCVRVRAVVDAA